MLNYILIGLGVLFIIISLLALGMGLSPTEEHNSPGGQIGWFIGSLIMAVPSFILGVVLLAVGLLRKPKSKE